MVMMVQQVKLELVLIIFLEKQQVVVDFVEIVVIQEQGTRDMEVVIQVVDVIVLDGGFGLVVVKE